MVLEGWETHLLFDLHDLIVPLRVLDTGLIELMLLDTELVKSLVLDTASLEVHDATHIVFEVLGATLVVALVDS